MMINSTLSRIARKAVTFTGCQGAPLKFLGAPAPRITRGPQSSASSRRHTSHVRAQFTRPAEYEISSDLDLIVITNQTIGWDCSLKGFSRQPWEREALLQSNGTIQYPLSQAFLNKKNRSLKAPPAKILSKRVWDSNDWILVGRSLRRIKSDHLSSLNMATENLLNSFPSLAKIGKESIVDILRKETSKHKKLIKMFHLAREFKKEFFFVFVERIESAALWRREQGAQ